MIISEKLRFLKNSLSNVVNGVSSAVFAIVLPYFFVRYFMRTEFGIWILVLQLAAYVNYLNFGLQVAVGRYISHAMEIGDRPMAERIVAAGVQLLSALALVGFVVIAVLAWSFPAMFRQVSPALVPTAQAALLWVGGALALGLPFTAFQGVFIGFQRNDIPAALAAVSKGVLAAVMIVAAARTRNLVFVAEVYFFGNLAFYLLQYAIFLRVCRHWVIRLNSVVMTEIRELLSYCVSLTAWSLAQLLIVGMGTVIVAIYDFREVAAFGVALSAVSFLVGLIQALLAPLIQVFTKLEARGQSKQTMHLLQFSSFACTLFLFTSAVWLIALAHPVFVLWVRPAIADQAVLLFDIMIVANAMRNSAAPYANFLIATGQQRRVILSPLAEGITNFGTSVIGAHYLGALGVALGALAGAIAGIGANYWYNFPRTLPSKSAKNALLTNGLLGPIPYTLPLVAAWALQLVPHCPVAISYGLMLVVTIGILYLVYGDIQKTWLRPARR
jgi:O-antigen/teichoic acid export membrane protein